MRQIKEGAWARKLAPNQIDIDRRRGGDTDGHVHEQPPTAVADLLEQRQA